MKLSEESAAYLLSLVSLIVFSLINRLLGESSITELYWFTLLFMFYGFTIYIRNIYSIFWDSGIGKIVISAMFFLGTTLSLSLSSSLINSSFEVTSTPFLYTQSILSVLIAPLVISLFFGIIGVFFLPVSMLLFTTDKLSFSVKSIFTVWLEKKRSYKEISPLAFIGRILSFVCVLSFCWSFNGNNAWYTNQLETIAKWYAYNIEMEEFSHCQLTKGEKVRYINKAIIVIGYKENESYKFKTDVCKL